MTDLKLSNHAHEDQMWHNKNICYQEDFQVQGHIFSGHRQYNALYNCCTCCEWSAEQKVKFGIVGWQRFSD